jgi:hypothetical protein
MNDPDQTAQRSLAGSMHINRPELPTRSSSSPRRHWYLHKCRIPTLTQHALTPLTLPSPSRARGEGDRRPGEGG